MKIRGKNRLMKLLMGVIPVLMFASCVRDMDIPSKFDNEEGTLVTLNIQVPGATTPATKALSVVDENVITQIDVLLFKKDGNGHFVDKGSSATITSEAGDNSRNKTVTVRLMPGEWDIVVLANARDMVNAHIADFAEKTKDQALALLITASNDNKWVATTGAGFKPFPMWGEMGVKLIDNDHTILPDATSRVKMTRMMARVDVEITGEAVSTFRLTSVEVYNRNTQGSLVPRKAEWDANDPPKAKAPNVPASLDKGPLAYNGSDINNGNCVREIYLFEAENHSGVGHTTPKPLTDRTCLVIGGVWDANDDGDLTNDAPTYYRLDFANIAGTSESYLDVLRNHRYLFKIDKVYGSGYVNSETAFTSDPMNLRAEVLEWNEHDFTEIVVGPNYTMGINKGLFEFTKIAHTAASTDNRLVIKTDHPGGWTATAKNDLAGTADVAKDATTNNPWLSLSASSTAGSTDGETTILFAAENNSGVERTAYIHVKVGTLLYKVKVTQAAAAGSMGTISVPGGNAAAAGTDDERTATVIFDGAEEGWTATLDPNDGTATITGGGSGSTGPGSTKVKFTENPGTNPREVEVIYKNSNGDEMGRQTVTQDGAGASMGTLTPPSDPVEASGTDDERTATIGFAGANENWTATLDPDDGTATITGGGSGTAGAGAGATTVKFTENPGTTPRTVEVIYKNSNGDIMGSETVTQKGVPLATSIDISVVGGGAASVVVGGSTITLKAEIFPSGAAQTVTWSSDTPLLASVNASGVVTGIAAGAAIIKATALDGSDVSGTMNVAVAVPQPGSANYGILGSGNASWPTANANCGSLGGRLPSFEEMVVVCDAWIAAGKPSGWGLANYVSVWTSTYWPPISGEQAKQTVRADIPHSIQHAASQEKSAVNYICIVDR